MKSSNVFDYLTTMAWAIHEPVLANFSEIVMRHVEGVKLSADEIKAAVQAASPNGVKTSPDYYVANGVAVIPIYGVISKYSAGVNSISQPQGTSMQAIREDLRAALSDPAVNAILLDVESAGGSTDGLAELADEIRASSKPVTAFANGIMASAAYWLGAQASEVVSSPSAIVGSIGVFSVVRDSSRAAENAGFRVMVVKAGEMKGGGTPGAPVTDAQLTEVQRIVNAHYSMFIDAVAKGRKIPADSARALGDGRIHVGAAAQQLGLVDKLETFEKTLARLQATATKSPAKAGAKKGERGMDAKTEAEIRAENDKRVKDIKAAFPKDPEFALHAITENWDVTTAKAHYSDKLLAEKEASDKAHAEEVAKLKADAEKKTETKPGNPALKGENKETETEASGTAGEQFIAKVDALVAAGQPRSRAVSKVSAKHPELHRAWLAEVNGEDRIEAKASDVQHDHGKKWI